MASSVFFKFKSQKDQQRVTFDGTGISVFELKRDIIKVGRMGDGKDFDLAIYNDNTNEEYDDDTTIVPRSTGVIAHRKPASRHGQGRGARYLSGKMPTMAKNAYRTEHPAASSKPAKPTEPPQQSASAQAPQTEEERIAEMMKAGADHFEQQKQQMASATPIFRQGAGRGGKHSNVPDNPPPPGYVCFRCRQKGHWIQNCPTNNDPNFENQPRYKRTTGIPRSFLRTVEQSEVSEGDGITEEKRHPSHVMIDSEGRRVIHVPDQASWEKYKATADTSASKDETAELGDKDLHDRGLECPIDKRLFIDPVKTPCCGKTYCNDCIENALVNSDLVCPNCSKEGVLIDDLTPDEETITKIKSYEEEKKALLKSAEASRLAEKSSTPPNDEAVKPKSPTPLKSNAGGPPSPMSPRNNSKKRRAEDQPAADEGKDSGPSKMRKTQSPSKSPSPAQQKSPKPGFKLRADSHQAFIEQMNALANSNGNPNGNANGPGNPALPNMPFPMPGMMNNPMMASNNGMQSNMMNQVNPMMSGMGPNGMAPNGMPPFNPMMMGSMPGANGMAQMGGGYGGPGQNNFQQWGPNGPGGPGLKNHYGQPRHPNNHFGRGKFPNQQPLNEEDSAYMRRPVNPNRMGARQRKQRPADYREL